MHFKLHSITAVADILRCRTDISHLVLSRNQIGDEGAKLLAEVLANDKSIIHLDLS